MKERKIAFPLLIGTVTLLLMPVAGQGDFVFLKDGFMLRGRVEKEGTIYVDPPSGQGIWMPKMKGFFIVDDYARRVVIPHHLVSVARPDPAEQHQEAFYINRVEPHPSSDVIAAIDSLEGATPWDNNGRRNVRVATPHKTFNVEQNITALTPYFLRVGARRQIWTCSMLTREFDPQLLLKIIRTHLEAKKNPNQLEDRFRLFRFCVQAEWFEEAEKELAGMLTDFPKEKEKIDGAMTDLRRLRAGRLLEGIELAKKTGQHQKAQELLAKFPEADAGERDLNQVRALRSDYEARNADLQSTRRLLSWVDDQTKGRSTVTEFMEALVEIGRDLHLDDYSRLDAFRSMAAQEERNHRQGKKTEMMPEQLHALAISGWVLGNSGAEADVGAAQRLWQARQFILRYLRAPGLEDRERVLNSYSQGTGLNTDVMLQIIELLPPPLAAPLSRPVSAEERENERLKSVEMLAKSESDSKETPYRVQLPPEYHHQRASPLLVVLHNAGEDAKKALDHWSELAARHGYLLVAPQWSDAFATNYRSTPEERAAVLSVLRDVRRRFQVDADRVFLTGFSHSAVMAYDVGLTHPDLFAGVVAMCGHPGNTHRTNGQLLPFYVVEGERDRDGPKENRELFEYWVPRGYPSIYVEYTGRGFEFFHGELPYIFDWMGRQKRGYGFPELGKPDVQGGRLGQEFRTHRQGENRFYWISSQELGPATGRDPAKVTARVDNNQIVIRMERFKQLTVWLNASMVNLDQQVEIRINPSAPTNRVKKQLATPSLQVLLEDYYNRGDKRNLFVAKVDFRW